MSNEKTRGPHVISIGDAIKAVEAKEAREMPGPAFPTENLSPIAQAFAAASMLVDGNGPRDSHASWLKEKADTGWKYGTVKDPAKKEHPCFVPYDELPEAQRAKDDVFTHVVTVVGTALGWPSAPPNGPATKDGDT